MRRLFSVITVFAVLATACGSSTEIQGVEAAAPTTTSAAVVTEDTATLNTAAVDTAPEQTDSETDAADEVAEEPVALRTGREAILANHTAGKPYVLWYWGAH